MVRTTLLLLIAFIGFDVPVFAQRTGFRSGNPDGIAWEPDHATALEKARKLDKPLMVFMTMNEKANEEIARNHLRRRDIIQASRDFVCLVSCLGTHASPPGHEGPVCERFGSITCGHHVRIEPWARGELVPDGKVKCPMCVWLAPDGKTGLARHVWTLSPKELRNKINGAYQLFKKEKRGGRHARVDAAIANARNRNLSKRRSALSSLVSMDDERVVSFLEKQTTRRAPRLHRLEAIMAMGESRQNRFLGVLHTLLESPDATTRSHAAVALEKIGDGESGPVLLAALRKERKGSVRANLLRGLGACGEDALIQDGIRLVFGKASRLDRLCGLFVLANVPLDGELKKTVKKLAGASNQQVRAAAYFVIGTHELADLQAGLERRRRSERNLTGTCLLWALAQIGMDVDPGDAEPEELIAALLPDQHLRDGELEQRRGRRHGVK
ncbi:MAG: hypothetical protein CMJ84_12150 [Planctomycetes bacterium]|nr:hypothetical protein [Planctomycetota bacterium]